MSTLQDPLVRKRFTDNGGDTAPSATPQAFGTFMQAELAKWAKLVNDAGIRPQ